MNHKWECEWPICVTVMEWLTVQGAYDTLTQWLLGLF